MRGREQMMIEGQGNMDENAIGNREGDMQFRCEMQQKEQDFLQVQRAFYNGQCEEDALLGDITQPFYRSLKLSRRRLKERKLTVDMEIEPDRFDSRIQSGEYYKGPVKDGYDYAGMHHNPVKVKKTYYRDRKIVGRQKDFETKVAEYSNVVDCALCHITFREVTRTSDGYRANVDVKMRFSCDTGRKIRNKYEKLALSLSCSEEAMEHHKVAVREYKCPGCGGSVDILSGAVCLYCGADLDYSRFGWVIEKYEKKKGHNLYHWITIICQ